MLEKKHLINLPALIMGFVLLAVFINNAAAQDQRWVVVGQLQSYFYDYGTETENESGTNFFSWPTQYSTDQTTFRGKGIWLGATDYFDPVQEKNKTVKVIGSGPRIPSNHYNMIFPQSIKMIGKYNHPTVIVDEQIASSNTLYDAVDEWDENLPCDRLVINKFNTSIGVSVTRKIYAFNQQNHDDYFIYDYVFKNTGIYNEAGDVYEQTLNNFYAYYMWRPSFSGVTSLEWGSTWGAFSSQWGSSNLIHNFTTKDPEGMRGFYSWYGPTNADEHPLSPQQDWGCPDHEDTGVLGSAKYLGAVVLFASKSADNFDADDENQPATDAYVGGDGAIMETAVSQYDEVFMQQRYNVMSEGHIAASQSEDCLSAVGTDGYVEDWTTSNPYRNTNTNGGAMQGFGFGGYTLAPGDSIRIVMAEGVNGISWEKCREIGKKWIAYHNGTSEPSLDYPPEGSNEWGFEEHNAYKRAWCETGVDSILKVFQNAEDNFNAGINVPAPPPPPENFTVSSGGNKITLTWSDNATGAPNFDGYVIYRSEGEVKQYTTVYKKVFECSGGTDLTHVFEDTSAVRGFNYYYYIQSKDDGSQNIAEPGKPLYSSLFWTLTSVPAYLRRPAGSFLEHVRVVPNPYDIRSRMFQFGEDYQYDRIAFYELPPVCRVKVFTERGDLIWEKEHRDGSGDELWDSITSSRQIIVSGVYILCVEVTEDIIAESDIYASRDYINPKNNEKEITVGDLLFQTGDVMYKKGDTVFRKFVVIR